MGGVVQGKLQYLNRRPAPGRRGWHLRAANLRAETCTRMSDMSGMSIQCTRALKNMKREFCLVSKEEYSARLCLTPYS